MIVATEAKRALRLPADPSSCLGAAVICLCFPYYCPHVTDAPEWSHGVTGTTGPLLLMASMQFFKCYCTVRVGLPETVFPSICSWSQVVHISELIVMFEQRSNAPPSTAGLPKFTSNFSATNCADNM